MTLASSRRRYHRTIFLGVAAMVLLIWTAVDQFGISWREMSNLFISIIIGVVALIALAGLFTAVWVGLRRVTRRSSRK